MGVLRIAIPHEKIIYNYFCAYCTTGILHKKEGQFLVRFIIINMLKYHYQIKIKNKNKKGEKEMNNGIKYADEKFKENNNYYKLQLFEKYGVLEYDFTNFCDACQYMKWLLNFITLNDLKPIDGISIIHVTPFWEDSLSDIDMIECINCYGHLLKVKKERGVK